MTISARSALSSMCEWLGVALLFAALTAIVTWPQPAHWLTHTHGHHDTLFSMWRLSWIGEALLTQPSRLFDAPIFHPEPRTLAFSDAVFLQGLLATPALAAGARVLPVYNALLLLGPWLSCLGTYLLVRSLLSRARAAAAPPPSLTPETEATRRDGAMADGRPVQPEPPGIGGVTKAGPGAVFWPAVIAGAIFGLLPYRIDHIMHLELQWSQWMPLTCWALHRTVWHGRIRDGVLTAAFVLAQFLSCIYYGVFLVMALTIAAPILLFARDRASLGRIARAFAVGAIVCAAPLVAYSAPYRANQERLGVRSGWEIATWSATPGSFVSAPPENRLYGRATAGFGSPEGRLLPGVTALGLALAGIWALRRAREAQFYLAVVIVSAVLAMGTYTPAYRLALALVPPLRGLRAPGRFGMVAALGLGVLASLGAAWLLTRLRMRARHAVGAALVGLLLIEYASDVSSLHAWSQRTPVYAMWLRAQPPGVVVDLPLPRSDELPLHEAEWSFYARFHGHPVVNGYSGYYPRTYLRLLDAMAAFPTTDTVERLRRIDVRYVVIHEDRYPGGTFLELDARLRTTPGLRFVGRVPDQIYPVTIYEIAHR